MALLSATVAKFSLSQLVYFATSSVESIGLLSMFYNDGGDKYGDRLTGIDEHKVPENITEDIKSLYESGVESVSVDVKGKIIYVILDVSNGIGKEDARGFAIKSLEKFSDDVKDFYDIQFMITCKGATEETTMYPMMGAKHSGNSQIIWTNN